MAMIEERDLTVPNWVDVLCPQCRAPIDTLNANAVNTAIYETVVCDCGFPGSLTWVNPNPPRLLWEQRRRTGHPLCVSRSSDSLSQAPEAERG